MPLNTTGNPVIPASPQTQAPGSVLTAVAKVRMSGKWSTDVAMELANVGHQLQDQVNRIFQLLSQPQPTLATFTVTDALGNLVGWIGDRASGAISYTGAWFRTFAIGGTGPSDAKVVVDTSGNLTITGAVLNVSTVGGATVITISSSLGLAINGASVIDIAKNATLASVSASSFVASGLAGISPTDLRVTAVTTSSAAFVSSVTISTNTISYAPGASTATYVSSVGTSSSNAITTAVATVVTDGYTHGIRTS